LLACICHVLGSGRSSGRDRDRGRGGRRGSRGRGRGRCCCGLVHGHVLVVSPSWHILAVPCMVEVALALMEIHFVREAATLCTIVAHVPALVKLIRSAVVRKVELEIRKVSSW